MNNLEVVIDPVVLAKVSTWVDECDVEVSGLGKVQVEHGPKGLVTLKITEAYIVEQDCDSYSTTMREEALARLQYEVKDVPGELLWWWHSHVNMGVFWSGTDLQMFEGYTGPKGSWLCGTVFNKKGERRSALMARTEFGAGAFIDQIPTYEGSVVSQEVIDGWREDIKAHVTRKVAPAKYVKQMDFSKRYAEDDLEVTPPKGGYVYDGPYSHWMDELEPSPTELDDDDIELLKRANRASGRSSERPYGEVGMRVVNKGPKVRGPKPVKKAKGNG